MPTSLTPVAKSKHFIFFSTMRDSIIGQSLEYETARLASMLFVSELKLGISGMTWTGVTLGCPRSALLRS